MDLTTQATGCFRGEALNTRQFLLPEGIGTDRSHIFSILRSHVVLSLWKGHSSHVMVYLYRGESVCVSPPGKVHGDTHVTGVVGLINTTVYGNL